MGTNQQIRGSALRLRLWIRRTPLLVLSLIFAAVGVALIAVFAIGSFSSTDSPQAPAVQHIVTQPEHIYDRQLNVTPPPTPSPTPQATPQPEGVQPLAIVIPDIGVDAPVNPYGLDANLAPEVPLNGYEVAWYNWSSEPGAGSNAVFAGHVTWQGTGVFYNLEKLAAGDEIILRGDDGRELEYTVQENFLVDPSDPNALSVMGPTDDDTITVITCGGTFYYSAGAQFGGDYTNRRVVRAHLTGATPAPAVALSGG